MLRSLAQALDADASAHLHALAAPAVVALSRPEVSEDVHQLLDTWVDCPAYVRGRCFDVLAANKRARALAPMYEPGRNLVRAVFLAPESRRLFPDWAEVAAQTAAALGAEADPRDPRTVRLVAELETDEEFRRLWVRHETRPARDELKHFAHPVVGSLALRSHDGLDEDLDLDPHCLRRRSCPGRLQRDQLWWLFNGKAAMRR